MNNEDNRNEDDDRRQRGLDEGTVKKIVTRSIVGAIILAIAVTFIFNRGSVKGPNSDKPKDAPEQELQIEDDRDKILQDVEGQEPDKDIAEEEKTIEDRAKESLQEAKKNLEKSDKPVNEDLTDEEMDVLTKDLQELFNYLGVDRSDYDGEYFVSEEYSQSIARQTEGYMAQQVNIATNLAGYKMDPSTAEWFYSDTKEVYQFTVSMKVEGRDDLIFSGNYNKDKQFFKIFKMHGHLDLNEFAS